MTPPLSRAALSLAILAWMVTRPVVAKTYNYRFASGEREIWSRPHEPSLVIGSLAELRQHWAEIDEFLPPMPFRFGDQWLLPAADGPFRTYPHRPGLKARFFSPNGDYVVSQAWEPRGPERRPASRLTMATTAGEVLWEVEDGPPHELCVTDDGWLVGFPPPYPASLRITFIDHRGEVVVDEAPILAGMTSAQVLPDNNDVLVATHGGISLYEKQGRLRWRWPPPEESLRGSIFARPGIDPLGRGIYALSAAYSTRGQLTSSAVILDRVTGAEATWLWRDERRVPPVAWSPGGRTAVLQPVLGIGLVDWLTGELLFWHQRPFYHLEGVEVEARSAEAFGASDSPARLAVPLMGGLYDSVFDGEGRRIWWCDVHVARLGYRLSADGSRLGVLVHQVTEGWDTWVVDGLLVYRVAAEG